MSLLSQTTPYVSGSSSSVSSYTACFGSNISCLATTVVHLINTVFVPVVFAISFLVFLYGVAKAYVFSGGDSGAREKGHKIVLWGIIGFAVMLSVWGIVNVVATTIGLSGSHAPAIPSVVRTY